MQIVPGNGYGEDIAMNYANQEQQLYQNAGPKK